MSIREEQRNKVCRILDDVLANRPTERDSLIVAVRKAFEALELFGNSEQLPSAQPERKTGKWISTDDGWDGEYFVCSVCGCPWTLIEGSPEDNGMNFCPNCGAYMGSEHDERTD